MGKREEKIVKYAKLGLTSSILAALGGVGALAIILPRWGFSENLIFMPPESRRFLPAVLALLVAVFLGVVGFLTGLEGAASGQGKVKVMGWVGFWVGVMSTMIGVILGLCLYFYRI